MAIEDLLNHCKTRIPWPIMRNILHSKGLPVGQGWDATITKLLSFERLGDRQAGELNVLEDSYFENLLAGEKAIRLFEVPPEYLNAVIPALSKCEVPESPFSESYPYPVSDEKLKEIENGSMLVGVEDLDEALAIVLSTKRFVTERKELNLEAVKPETREELSGYDEIITVKHNMRQFFDVVVLWKQYSYVEIRLDLGEGLSTDDQHLAFKGIKSAFNAIVQACSGVENFLGQPINLFPLVDRLYTAGEGRVCELGFMTDGASIKHEKMRRKDTDLRVETYHRAGKNAVHHITPYRLGVTWSIIENARELKPELLLPGNFRVVSSPVQSLTHAKISNCSGFRDFDFVVAKMRQYLPAI